MPSNSVAPDSLAFCPSARLDHRHKGPLFGVFPLGLEYLSAAQYPALSTFFFSRLFLSFLKFYTPSEVKRFAVAFSRRTVLHIFVETRLFEYFIFNVWSLIEVELIRYFRRYPNSYLREQMIYHLQTNKPKSIFAIYLKNPLQIAPRALSISLCNQTCTKYFRGSSIC